MPQESLKVIAGDPQKPLLVGDVEIPCYVLEDKTRVITQRGLYNALGIARGGSRKIVGAKSQSNDSGIPKKTSKSGSGSVELPRFAQQNWLSPYISDELSLVLRSPISFYLPTGGLTAYGFPATILTSVCRAILQAHHDGTTTQRQSGLVRRVEILLHGFADIGILGLVDEATGYEKVREEQALATILEQYIARELRPWIKTFPDEYYEHIYRLWESSRSTSAKNHPQFVGKLTNKLIYSPLAPGVLEELRKTNPVLESGRRGAKHHQYLTENHGVIKLREHIASVVTLMRISYDKSTFERRFNEAFGHRQLQLLVIEELDEP